MKNPLSPSNLNLVCRLVLAYQDCPHLLNDAERFRQVTGRSARKQAEILRVVRRMIKGVSRSEGEAAA